MKNLATTPKQIHKILKAVKEAERNLEVSDILSALKKNWMEWRTDIQSLPINNQGVNTKSTNGFILSGMEWVPVSIKEVAPNKSISWECIYLSGEIDKGKERPFKWAMQKEKRPVIPLAFEDLISIEPYLFA